MSAGGFSKSRVLGESPQWMNNHNNSLRHGSELAEVLGAARACEAAIRGRMIFLQEELDWFCYEAYGLLPEEPQINANQRK